MGPYSNCVCVHSMGAMCARWAQYVTSHMIAVRAIWEPLVLYGSHVSWCHVRAECAIMGPYGEPCAPYWRPIAYGSHQAPNRGWMAPLLLVCCIQCMGAIWGPYASQVCHMGAVCLPYGSGVQRRGAVWEPCANMAAIWCQIGGGWCHMGAVCNI
jgi:hypothetical protein